MTPDVSLAWSLVIPVKVLAQAKSRLTGLPAADRAELALAMAADTIAAAVAAVAVRTVVVVTDDPDVGSEAAGLGAVVLSDEPAAGLNEALTFGSRYAAANWPDQGVAGLAGDLPALRPAEVTAALAAAAVVGRAFVPDADGTGTTLYATTPGQRFEPLFGPSSRERHLAAGATELASPDFTGLRQDVDTAADLDRAASIGVGPRTNAVLRAHGSARGV